MTSLTLISLGIFIVYLGLVLGYIKHIPHSLSETYYLIGKSGPLFTIMMFAISVLLMPAMIELTNPNFQFMAFLPLTAIAFVGAAPNFKDEFEGKVHTTSAIIAAAIGLLWVIFLTKFWYIPLVSSGIILLLGLITKSLKYGKTFWLEMIAFLSVYSAAILTAF